jgi:hypothetical protein
MSHACAQRMGIAVLLVATLAAAEPADPTGRAEDAARRAEAAAARSEEAARRVEGAADRLERLVARLAQQDARGKRGGTDAPR